LRAYHADIGYLFLIPGTVRLLLEAHVEIRFCSADNFAC